MSDHDNVIVFMMATPEVVITIKVISMKTLHEDKQVTNIVAKDAQNGWSSYFFESS